MKNAQGSLEYLLLIGGTALVALVVILVALNIFGTGEEGVKAGEETAFGFVRESREAIAESFLSSIIANPGFEVDDGTNYNLGGSWPTPDSTADNGVPDGWGRGPFNITSSLDQSETQSGTGLSWKVTTNAGDHYPHVSQPITGERLDSITGKTVKFTVWVKPLSEASGPMRLTLDQYVGGTINYSQGSGNRQASTGTAWQQLDVTYAVPPGTTELKPRITIESNSGANTTGKTAYIDDARLVVLSS